MAAHKDTLWFFLLSTSSSFFCSAATNVLYHVLDIRTPVIHWWKRAFYLSQPLIFQAVQFISLLRPVHSLWKGVIPSIHQVSRSLQTDCTLLSGVNLFFSRQLPITNRATLPSTVTFQNCRLWLWLLIVSSFQFIFTLVVVYGWKGTRNCNGGLKTIHLVR